MGSLAPESSLAGKESQQSVGAFVTHTTGGGPGPWRLRQRLVNEPGSPGGNRKEVRGGEVMMPYHSSQASFSLPQTCRHCFLWGFLGEGNHDSWGRAFLRPLFSHKLRRLPSTMSCCRGGVRMAWPMSPPTCPLSPTCALIHKLSGEPLL